MFDTCTILFLNYFYFIHILTINFEYYHTNKKKYKLKNIYSLNHLLERVLRTNKPLILKRLVAKFVNEISTLPDIARIYKHIQPLPNNILYRLKNKPTIYIYLSKDKVIFRNPCVIHYCSVCGNHQLCSELVPLLLFYVHKHLLNPLSMSIDPYPMLYCPPYFHCSLKCTKQMTSILHINSAT